MAELIHGAFGAVESGDPHTAEELLPLVYNELRTLAAATLAQERPDLSLHPTALVHEAYLRLMGSPTGAMRGRELKDWNSRGHFFSAAAESMRRILVERARRQHRLKRGGHCQRVDFDSGNFASTPRSVDLLALDEALDKLAAAHPLKADVVKLRFFAGMTTAEAAVAMNVSLATAERYWAFARGWLYAELADRPSGPDDLV